MVNRSGSLLRYSVVRLTDASPYVSKVPGYLKTHIIMTFLDGIFHEVDYKRKLYLIIKESKHGDRTVYFYLQCTTV